MRKMWGNFPIWHDHDKFRNFTNSFQITYFWVERLLFHKFQHFKNDYLNELI